MLTCASLAPSSHLPALSCVSCPRKPHYPCSLDPNHSGLTGRPLLGKGPLPQPLRPPNCSFQPLY